MLGKPIDLKVFRSNKQTYGLKRIAKIPSGQLYARNIKTNNIIHYAEVLNFNKEYNQ
jgi:hypothetical protein